MPVQFKNTTEYSRQFTPHESQNIDVQMGKKVAGVDSDRLALSCEPPIQHKKRLDGPPTSLSTNFYDRPTRDAEYMVLGQQDKFSENVRYNLKNPKNQGKIYKNKENMDEEAPPNKQLRMQKRIKPLLKERHPPIFQSPPRKSVNEDVTSHITPQSPPPAPRVETSLDLDEVKATLKDKDLKDVLGESHGKNKQAQGVKAQQPKEKPTAARREDKVGVSVMNESVQTNMKKGVAQAAPEAPAEYALKYKAGVAPSRVIKKFSEYQKQFQWKNGMKASPLLAAEQIVYTSNTELGPYKNEAIPKVSEYRREFQRWKPMDVSSSLNVNANNNNNNSTNDSGQDCKRNAVIKRSKSAAADSRKQKLDESKEDPASELKEKLKKSHGKMRRTGSEYKSNFKAPSSYYSSKGAWKGADPPQLMPVAQEKNDVVEANANNNASADVDSVPMSNWFAEVVELRRRADEYRKRAQGTHFSREHLVQLMAQQNECWDVNSQASSTVRALNLEAPKISKKLQRGAKYSPILSDIEIEDIEQELEDPPVVVKKSYKSSSPDGQRMARMRKDKEAVSQQQRKMKEKAQKERDADFGEDDASDDIVDEDEGRQPTPKLKQARVSVGRHHLDLTTPAVGGALLTCPPSKNSKMIVTSRSGDSYVTASDNMEVPQGQKKINMDNLKTRPILGQPSGDSHALRDDDASSDRPLNTRYVPSPALVIASDEDKENAPTKKGGNKSVQKQSKTTKPSSLTPVQEGVGKTYAKSKPFLTLDDIRANEKNAAVIDDDVMSVSMMSVASSATLASEILERAKRRQKEFWGKGGDA